MVLVQIGCRTAKLQSKSRFGCEIAGLRIIALILGFLLCGPFSWQVKAESSTGPSSLAEMAGQLIIIGFEGDTSSSPGFREMMSNLESGLAGGVIFMGHNVRSRKDLLAMTDRVRKCRCRFKPLIAIDEEGGKVERLTDAIGFRSSPSAEAVALLRDEKRAAEIFDQIALDVRAAGFNLNLAPVVDLDINPFNPVVGALGRSYSRAPETVYRLARLFVDRHRRLNVLTSIKHFPGHGSSSSDPHLGYVDVTESWTKAELIPFQLLILDGHVDMIMVGHVSSDNWGGSASLAPSQAITSLLREKLGYTGIVITDDLDMGAITRSNPNFGNAIKRALLTGNDILLVSNHHTKRRRVAHVIHSAILSFLANKEIEPSRVEESFDRIQKLKSQLHQPVD
jgi:beta-N-acetylhexosaminidase